MSLNQFSQETLWWAHQQSFMEPNPNQTILNSSLLPLKSSSTSNSNSSSWPSWLNHHPSSQENPSFSFNLNKEETLEQEQEQPQPHVQNDQNIIKEAMFEKPLTPSDVGKLNRLVIPKQHAEKYFPLSADSVDKGLLLSFEDELGKCWRFRYSYWNSSQSYVLTKGWSRYVKEKQLDAGDVVLFERHPLDSERLFIGWRRRCDNNNNSNNNSSGLMMMHGSNSGVWSRGLYQNHQQILNQNQPYHHGHGSHVSSSHVQYQNDSSHAGSIGHNQHMPIGNSKRFRLFGVNLECQADESEPSTPDGSSMSSQGPNPQHQYYASHSSYSSSNSSQSHMDITFSRDVNQMRNRRG